MSDSRQKNIDWSLPNSLTWEHVQVALLMDIRDELRAIRRLGECWRLPRALDAMIEVGTDLRRKKRQAAAKRKAVKARRA